MKIKRLSLEFWMTLVDTHVNWENIASDLKEVPVVFKKDGWYLKDKVSWWEYKGKAYTSGGLYKTFVWAITHALAQNFTKDEAKKLREVCKFLGNPLKRKLQEQLNLWSHNAKIRNIERGTKLFLLKRRK